MKKGRGERGAYTGGVGVDGADWPESKDTGKKWRKAKEGPVSRRGKMNGFYRDNEESLKSWLPFYALVCMCACVDRTGRAGRNGDGFPEPHAPLTDFRPAISSHAPRQTHTPLTLQEQHRVRRRRPTVFVIAMNHSRCDGEPTLRNHSAAKASTPALVPRLLPYSFISSTFHTILLVQVKSRAVQRGSH